MKKFLPVLFFSVLIFSGCGSSRKQLERGNYDAAIATAVKQLRRDPNDEKQAATLERSFKVVNEQDNERIRFLKMEGRPQNWDEIYLIYKRMSDRQSLVRTVMPLNVGNRPVEFPYVDYMPQMVEAKRKSADFYYAHGTELMKTGIKENYRQAFAEFVRAKEYVGDYEGIDSKIEEARYLGISRVYVSVQNTTMIKFPPEFEEDLLNIDLQALNGDWIEFHTVNLDKEAQYDYFINVNVRNIAVSPDRSEQRDSVIRRDVEDGFNYKLDSRGNVMKDTLGNDIKIKKYKTLQCALVTTYQSKACKIDGDVEIIEMNPSRVVKKDPIGAQSTFENMSARAIGDLGALSPSQLERTKSQLLPFPSDIEMVLRCAESLKQAIRGSIQVNRRLII